MKKKTLFICIVVLVFILILISLILLIDMYYLKYHVNDKLYNEQLNELSDLEKMSSSELANLFYNGSTSDNFVNNNVKNYQFSYQVADSREDAIEKTKSFVQSNDELLEIKLLDDTEYYYVIYLEYILHGVVEDVIFKNSYLYFKNNILDFNNNIINLNVLNNASKIKDIFNLYLYVKNSDNRSIKLLLSEILENDDGYIYTYYYFNTTYGDWGLSDNIKLYKCMISINNINGEYESTCKMIRNIAGKYNNAIIE